MKKTLIAASIAALAAGSAQAVELYSSETGSFSTYGKVQLQLNNFDGENEIQNNGSRFGFKGETLINNDLTAFANAEFRFNAGFQHEAALTVRNSYVGVKGSFGSVKAGNFDNLYYTGVSSVLDLFEQDGYRALVTDGGRFGDGDILDANGDPIVSRNGASRGFTLAYETADLSGFTLGIAAKHFNSEDSRGGSDYPSASKDGDEQWNLQAYVAFTGIENLTLALAVDQNNEDAWGAPTKFNESGDDDYDPIIGFSATYELDALTASVLVEQAGDLTHFGVGGNYSLGDANIYGLISWLDDDADDGVDFALGANYYLASTFYVYGEVAVGNDDLSSIYKTKTVNGEETDEGVTSITLGASYSW